MEDKKYPIGGFAPGNYHNKCVSCGNIFTGDKRAFECEPCAIHSTRWIDHMIEVLQFFADKHELGKTGYDLLSEYQQMVYKKFLKSDEYKKLNEGPVIKLPYVATKDKDGKEIFAVLSDIKIKEHP